MYFKLLIFNSIIPVLTQDGLLVQDFQTAAWIGNNTTKTFMSNS